MEDAKILFIGDPHIQVDNIPEVEKCIEKLVALANEKQPDIIVLAGDLLHTHERLHTTALNKSYGFVNKMREIAKTYILVGNHDMCVAKNTPILLYNGNIKFSQHINSEDVLIGDDGCPRYIKNIKSGISEMYTINQSNGDSYTVTANHILTLRQNYSNRMIWKQKKSKWVVKWMDVDNMELRSKSFKLSQQVPCDILSKEEAKTKAEIFLNSLRVKNIIDIPIKDYIKLPQNVKDYLFSYKSKGVRWNYKSVLLNAYMMGLLLGDKTNNGHSFISSDIDIINSWVDWAIENNIYVIHTGENTFSFSFDNNKSESIIGHEKNSYNNCSICVNTKMSLACINSKELEFLLSKNDFDQDLFTDKDSLKIQLEKRKQIEMDFSKYKPVTKISKNPLLKIIKRYDLYNKHIPYNYIVTDYYNRIQLLAGFIDMTEKIKNNDGSISVIHSNISTIQQLEYICRSMGLYTFYSEYKEKNHTHSLCIFGNLSIIPTRKETYRNFNNVNISIEVVPSKPSQYYGWEVDGNNRFLLGDFTVTHNCNNSQFLTSNHWMNGLKEWKNVVIVDKVISETIKNKLFVFVPYVSVGRFEEALKTSLCEWTKASCIFAHQEFFGCKMGAIVSTDGDKWPLHYPKVISGHIHSRQKPQDNIYYPGSMLQHAFGESAKNIIAFLSFNESPEYKLEEIDLELPRKKIVYMDVENVDDYTIAETKDKIKITVSGSYEQFKALKKTKKYKKIIDNGIKVVFKPKKIELEIKVPEKINNDTSFSTILKEIINIERDINLFQVYELVVNNKYLKEDDILLPLRQLE